MKVWHGRHSEGGHDAGQGWDACRF
jgi:hypothetical protein